MDVPADLPAVLAARRPARQVREGAQQSRRFDLGQPDRRRHAPQVEGPAGDGRPIAGLPVLRRRARPGRSHRQHRHQDRRHVLRPVQDPGGPATQARLRQRGLGVQRPAGEPRVRRRAGHGGGGVQGAGPLHAARRPHRRRRRLRGSSSSLVGRASPTSCTCPRCRATASGTLSSWCRWRSPDSPWPC